MNWYVYTGNDPVNHVDLWGLATEDGQKPADGYNVFSTVDGTYKGSQWDDPNNHNSDLVITAPHWMKKAIGIMMGI